MRAARQAHYIEWCRLHDIDDPCGPEPGFERVVAIYIKCVILGVNYHNRQCVRSKTAQGYTDAVNSLFKARHFPLPAVFSTAGNMSAILVENLYKEEKIANQRCPLDNKIFAQLHSAAKKSRTSDSIDQVLFNIVALGRYIGPRISEFAQKKQSSVDHHTYPSGTKVVKAFATEDFTFFDADGTVSIPHPTTSLPSPKLYESHGGFKRTGRTASLLR